MSAGKIILIIANQGFQDQEYFLTRAELECSGYQVMVGSDAPGQALGKFSARVAIDYVLSEIDPSDYAALVFIGGPGAEILKTNPVALELASSAFTQGLVLGAICIAPLILAQAGLLNNKQATVWVDGLANQTAKELEQFGARYTGEAVTVDGRIITANGPAVAPAFGQAIVRVLSQK